MGDTGPASVARRAYRAARGLPRRVEQRRLHTRLRADSAAPELLLSPHFDDAVFDCWALVSSERDVQVVNVFAGAPAPGDVAAWDAMTGAGDSAARVRERIAEDARALARAGRTPRNLANLDAQYRSRLARVSLDALDSQLAAPVTGVARVHATAGIGGHRDHALVRDYACLLARSGIPVTLYADLPYCILHGWPHWVDGREPDPHRDVERYWLSFLAGVPGMPSLRSARVERLDDAAAASKLAAMRCYETQFACLDYGGRGLLSDPEIHRFEVSWEISGGG